MAGTWQQKRKTQMAGALVGKFTNFYLFIEKPSLFQNISNKATFKCIKIYF